MVAGLPDRELRVVGPVDLGRVAVDFRKLILITARLVGSLQGVEHVSWILFCRLIVPRRVESQVELSYLQSVLHLPSLIHQP